MNWERQLVWEERFCVAMCLAFVVYATVVVYLW